MIDNPEWFRSPTEYELQYFGNSLEVINRICGTNLNKTKIVNLKTPDKSDNFQHLADYIDPDILKKLKEVWKSNAFLRETLFNLPMNVQIRSKADINYDDATDTVEINFEQSFANCSTFFIPRINRDASNLTFCNESEIKEIINHEFGHARDSYKLRMLSRSSQKNNTMKIASNIIKNLDSICVIDFDILSKSIQALLKTNEYKKCSKNLNALYDILSQFNELPAIERKSWLLYHNTREIFQLLGFAAYGSTLYINPLSDMALYVTQCLPFRLFYNNQVNKNADICKEFMHNDIANYILIDQWEALVTAMIRGIKFIDNQEVNVELINALFKLQGLNTTFERYYRKILNKEIQSAIQNKQKAENGVRQCKQVYTNYKAYLTNLYSVQPQNLSLQEQQNWENSKIMDIIELDKLQNDINCAEVEVIKIKNYIQHLEAILRMMQTSKESDFKKLLTLNDDDSDLFRHRYDKFLKKTFRKYREYVIYRKYFKMTHSMNRYRNPSEL